MSQNTILNTKLHSLLTITFIFLLFISNMAEIKVVNFFGISQLGAGTIFFPLLYVLNDIITEVYGFSASRRTIWLALIFNISFSLIMYSIIYLPEGDDWLEKDAFETIFNLTPRIMAGSLISYFLGELINASIISHLKLKFNGQFFAMRAIFSTFISSFVESILFGIIAFYKRMPDDELIKMIVTLSLVKVFYEIIVMPFTIIFISYLKKLEQLDVYEKPSFRNIFPKW